MLLLSPGARHLSRATHSQCALRFWQRLRVAPVAAVLLLVFIVPLLLTSFNRLYENSNDFLQTHSLDLYAKQKPLHIAARACLHPRDIPADVLIRWDCNECSAWIAKSKPYPLDLAIQGEQIRQICKCANANTT